jgi:threonyl-tRNA synthetase
MIHRAILGSVERFFGALIEHYAGAFPVWLSPVQVAVIPITDAHNDFAKKIKEDLQQADVRVIIDARNESLGKRIRENTMRKIPYVLVVGDKEVQENKVSVRAYSGGDLGSMDVAGFTEKVVKESKEKTS